MVALWRYPVKSMAGEPLKESPVSWHGFEGDRRWAFLKSQTATNGFPWFTIREQSELIQYSAFLEADPPENPRTMVRAPDGSVVPVTDEQLRARFAQPTTLMRLSTGAFDTFPLSLISTQSIQALGSAVGMQLDARRFRPNIVVDAGDGAMFPEDEWVGHELTIGTLRMRVDKRDGRCVVVAVDPDTGARSPGVLRTIAQERQQCLGVYGSVVGPGTVHLGDTVTLHKT